ncbi:MAG: HDOD domain-containing protein [Pseudomonadota bacterium]|jgi:signal transduction histidine kinase/HD-like signal output (HDOD) protein
MTFTPADLAADLDLSRLPAHPQVVGRLLHLLEQDKPAVAPITQMVVSDPCLCLRVISAAAAAGVSVTNVSLPTAAIAAVGNDLLRAIAVSAAAPVMGDGGLELEDFWSNAVLCAELSRTLARQIGYEAADEAYVAGLLHNIGQVALLYVLKERYVPVLEAAAGPGELPQVEGRELGVTHPEVAGELVDRWRLRSFIGDALRFHHHPVVAAVGSHPLVRILRCASAMVGAAPDRFDAAAALLGLSQAAMDGHWREAQERAQALAADLDVTLRSAAGPAVAALVPVALLERGDGAPAGVDRQLLAALNSGALRYALTQTFGHARSDAEVLACALRCAAGLVGLAAPLYFLPEASGKTLRGHGLWPGTEAAEDLRIPLNAAASAVAAAYMDAAMVSRAATAADATVLDRQVMRFLQGNLLCVPLMAEGKPAGVMVARAGESADGRKDSALVLALARFVGEALERRKRGTGDEVAQRELVERYRAHARRIIHEAGNPLGIIKNYLRVLALRLGSDNSVQQELSILNEEIDRVTQIIRRFGEAPAATARKDGLADINDTLKEMMTAYGEALFGTRRISVELALDPEIPPIKTDEDGLKQALLNLFKNAAEAMPAGGKFVVATSDMINHDGKTFVEIRIKDNGPGIPPETMQRLYQPVASAKGEGHEGLGLSIVLSVIHRLGGTIMCRSQEGQGTVFQLLLPRHVE